MLNIGPPVAEAAGPAIPQATTQEPKKSYGKQVSLNELFQGIYISLVRYVYY